MTVKKQSVSCAGCETAIGLGEASIHPSTLRRYQTHGGIKHEEMVWHAYAIGAGITARCWHSRFFPHQTCPPIDTSMWLFWPSRGPPALAIVTT